MMRIDKIRREALLQGYTLVPVSGILRTTLKDVKRGCDRASALAAAQRIAPTAASNRLAALADRLGVLGRSKEKDGREVIFSISKLGKAVQW